MSILPPKKPLLKRKLPLNPQPPLAGQKARKRRSALPLPLLNRRQIFSTARRQLQPRLEAALKQKGFQRTGIRIRVQSPTNP